jgi:hypothetical protein
VVFLFEVDKKGRMVRGSRPVIDGTLQGPDALIELTAFHLHRMGAAQARVVTFVADGAPWIWKRLDWVIAQVKLDPDRVVEVLDWCHAVHHLSVALADLPLTEGQRKGLYQRLRGLLKAGKSQEVIAELKVLAVNEPDGDALVLELAAGREFSTTEPHEIASAGRQHLGPQLTRDSPDRFLVEIQALPCQLRARLFDGQQTDQTTHFGLRIGAATLTDSIGRQFGIETASLSASSPAGAPMRGAVQGHHRDRQAAQKADHQRASFFSTGRSGTSASPITLSMCGTVSGCSLALASSPAT